MSARIPVPGFPAVTVDAQKGSWVRDCRRGYVEAPAVYVHYIGAPDELVRLGLVTEASLGMRPRSGKRSPRLDIRGNRFTVDRHFLVRDGIPIGIRVGLCFSLEPDRALELPGVREAIAADEASEMREEQAITSFGSAVPATDLPLAQVFTAGGEPRHRDRAVGAAQRQVRYIVNGNLIAPDWREVRSRFSAGRKDAG